MRLTVGITDADCISAKNIEKVIRTSYALVAPRTKNRLILLPTSKSGPNTKPRIHPGKNGVTPKQLSHLKLYSDN